MAMEHDAVRHTADADFIPFRRLRRFNPITGTGSANLRRTKSTKATGKADQGRRVKLRL